MRYGFEPQYRRRDIEAYWMPEAEGRGADCY
jgi:hypothetical protein